MTGDDPTPMTSRALTRPVSRPALRSWLALGLAVPAAFVAMWIVVPAPNRALLPLAVGAPEVSALLLLVAVIALLLALVDLRRQARARWAALCAVVAIGLSASPFVRFHAVADDAEQSLRLALGGDYLARIPAVQRAHFRAAPLMVASLFRGLGVPSDTVLTRRARIVDASGAQMTYDVYQPTTAGVHPVLVQIYGGAWQRGEPSDFAEFATYIAAQGYVVFAIDYRHAPQYRFPSPLDDVRAALRLLNANAARWNADMTRLVLIGRSAGAHLAMLAAYAPDAPPIRGVIDYYGPVDLVEGYRHPPSPDPLQVRLVEEALMGGTPDAMPERYRVASPISFVTRHLPPTLLIYGGRDHIVEPRFGDLLAGRLRAEGNTVIHVEIPWAEHAFDTVPNGPSGQLARYVTERFLASVTQPSIVTP